MWTRKIVTANKQHRISTDREGIICTEHGIEQHIQTQSTGDAN